MLKHLACCSCVVLLCSQPLLSQDSAKVDWGEGVTESIGVGSNPPPLALGSFIKGAAFDQFEPGTIYVIEFWATWCRPCLAQIPHFNQLQQEYPKVVFLWSNVWDADPGEVRRYVAEMGDRMKFSVALDSDCDQDGNGAMSRTWLPMLGGKGLPGTVIVDGAGRIAWIGAPQQIDEPLRAIHAGKWRIDLAAEQWRTRRKVEQTLDVFNQKIMKSLDESPGETAKLLKDFAQALETISSEIK